MNRNRRDFIAKLGLSAVPFLLPDNGLNAMSLQNIGEVKSDQGFPLLNFIYDGLEFSPVEYLRKLEEINHLQAIEADFYGNGGVTKLLEEEFARITGKEKAIYLPTGTMANQLAIKLLNKDNTKVIVPENSHIYRDEADAAQSVHSKRLVPVGKDKAFFDVADLEDSINYLNANEVFKSGLGTVVVESPVRRANGATVPIQTIREISNYCKEHNYKVHLDGARIHLGAAFNQFSISEYASYFDTIYISLYKYLNAGGGAILCGKAEIIDQVSHQIKILGGTVFQSWQNTAMALHYLNGINERWKEVVMVSEKLIADLNRISGLNITKLQNGSNIFDLRIAQTISLKKLANYLYKEQNIMLGRANGEGIVRLAVNDSLLTRDYNAVIEAWKNGVDQARS